MADQKETKKVKMLADAPGKDNTTLLAGRTYDVTVDSANWLVGLGRAEYVGKDVKASGAESDDTGNAANTTKNSDEMTVAELQADLKARGIELGGVTLKDDLVKLHKKALKVAEPR